jgi:hypothetical protein
MAPHWANFHEPGPQLWEASPTPISRDMTTNHRPRRRLLDTLSATGCCLWLAFILVLPGCHRSSLELAPVHGKVMIDGKTLFQGKVMFAPVAKVDAVNPGKPGWGDIQADGSFRLTTIKKDDGAVVGEHRVTIMNSDEKLPKGVPAFSRLIVPKKAIVAANTDNEINFAFSSSEVKKLSEDNH